MNRNHRVVHATLNAVIAFAVTGIVAAAVVVTSGRGAVAVTRGESMEPTYHDGDLVIVARKASYRIGEVAAYRQRGTQTVFLHRIVGGDHTGFLLRGDNNTSIDIASPRMSDVVGTAVAHVPRVGAWLKWLSSPLAVAAYAFLVVAGGGTATYQRRKNRRARRAAATTAATRSPEVLRRVAITAGVGVVAAAALAALTWGRPVEQEERIHSTAKASVAFDYSAPIRRSAAYDGVVVTAPETVFRRLSDHVMVTYRYVGPPAVVQPRVEIKTSSGWRTDLGDASSAGASRSGQVKLDLAAIERRVDAATSATGTPAGGVTVSVLVDVVQPDGSRTTSRLPFSLTPHTLNPAGPLRTTHDVNLTTTAQGPVHLSAMGRSVSIGAARTAAGAALGASALALLIVGALARARGTSAEGDRLRRRYKDHLLPVLPMILPVGGALIEVPDIASLVRIADRYGLLVLSWSRGGVDTYAVQDAAVTYRYQSTADVRAAVTPAPRDRHAPQRLPR